MTAVLSVVFPVIAAICVLIAVGFFIRALQARMQRDKAAYGVARIETRQSVFLDVLRALAAIVVALGMLVAFYVVSQQADLAAAEPGVTPSPPVVETAVATPAATPTDAPTAAPSATATQPAAPATNTPTVADATPSPSPEPAATDTPATQTAVVTSGVGVWLRAEPSTESEQLEWVLEGTVLTVLSGAETNEDFLWQQVRTPDGNEGWVAADFITLINNP